MMALNNHLTEYIKDEYEIHYSSKAEIYQKLLEKFPSQHHFIHEILMPTPIDGKMGPSVTLSMLNLLLPISKNPPLLKQISNYLKAARIIVAGSPPPYTICEYNLNFSDKVKEKVTYVGHFATNKVLENKLTTNLEKLIQDNEFGYWMRTGNRSTNDVTGEKYEEVFHDIKIKSEKRIISHARNDPSIDRVLGKDGTT